MIERHWDGMAGCSNSQNKISLGFGEGLHHKIRVLQRRAYDGLRDEEYLRLKILTSMLKEISFYPLTSTKTLNKKRRFRAVNELTGRFPGGQYRVFFHGSRMKRPGRADADTDRVQPFFKSVWAEIAFLHLSILPELGYPKWTDRQAHPASNAIVWIDQHQAPFPNFIDGPCGTDLPAGRNGTMHAGEGEVC